LNECPLYTESGRSDVTTKLCGANETQRSLRPNERRPGRRGGCPGAREIDRIGVMNLERGIN